MLPLIALVVISFFAAAQTKPPLHQFVATVTDKDDHYVTDLRPQDFVIEVNGEAVRPAALKLEKDAPLTLGLLIDNSTNMSFTMGVELESALAFLEKTRTADEFFLMITNSSGTSVRQDLTRDRARMTSQLAMLQSLYAGGTDILAGMSQAVQKARGGSHGKRAVIVLSDGGLPGQASELAGGVLIYPVQVLPPIRPTQPQPLPLARKKLSLRIWVGPRKPIPEDPAWTAEVESRRSATAKTMAAAADRTGGRMFSVPPEEAKEFLTDAFTNVFKQLDTELRSQYAVQVEASADAKIRIRMANPKFKVRICEF